MGTVDCMLLDSIMKKISYLKTGLLALLITLSYGFLLAQAASGPPIAEDIPMPPHSLRFEANVGQFNEATLYRVNDAQAIHTFSSLMAKRATYT